MTTRTPAAATHAIAVITASSPILPAETPTVPHSAAILHDSLDDLERHDVDRHE
jgi:hypothetical protein